MNVIRQTSRLNTAHPTVRTLLNFTKVEHTLFSLPLLFAGARLASTTIPPLDTLLLILTAALGARVFGMAINRIVDRRIDAKNPRTANRELPRGRLSVRAAAGVALSGLGVYLVSCALLGGVCLKLSFVPLIPLFFYSYLKRFTFLCHFGIGLSLALAPLGAYVAVAQTTEPAMPVLLLGLFTFFWLAGSDIIYAMLDIEFDRRHGVHSIPARFGERTAQGIASACHLLALGAIGLLVWNLGLNPQALIALVSLVVTLTLLSVSAIPPQTRFFPISAIAGMAGAFVAIAGVSG